MKKCIVYSLTLLALLNSSFAADLPINAVPQFQYSHVAINSLKGAKLKVNRIPESSSSVAFYKGTLNLELNVEGNLCLGDSRTFGLMTDVKLNRTKVTLLAGTKLPIPENMGCAQHSLGRLVKVSLDIDFPIFKGQKPISTYYIITVGNSNETLKIHVYEENEELKLKY